MADQAYKGRQALVYFPNSATLEQFKQRAKDAHKSLSSFIIETVEDYQRLQIENEPKPNLKKQIMSLRQEIDQLQEELRIKTLAIKQLEASNKIDSEKKFRPYAFGPFDELGIPIGTPHTYYWLTEAMANAFMLFKQYQGQDLQRELKKVDFEDLLFLEDQGLIEEAPNGWRLAKDVKI